METFSQSPIDAAFVQNPYRFYDRVRAKGDLFRWSDTNRVCATSHAVVTNLLRDKNWGREVPADLRQPIPDHLAPFYAIENHSMLERDAPTHTRLRAQVTRAFTSSRIASFGPEIETLANSLIDNFTGTSPDLITDYCTPIPVAIITRLLGVPADMASQLLDWSHDMVAMYQATRTRQTEDKATIAATQFSDYLSTLISERRKSPKNDLISALISTTPDTLAPAELTATCILLLNAGHEATVHALGNAIKTLLQSNMKIAPLLANQTCAQTIEEAIRFDPPLHIFERHVKTDTTAYGHTFKRGDTVALMLACANRDPSVYDNANKFDPTKKRNPHTSFGGGIHFCVGAPLARLEMQIALKTLFTRLPNLRLANVPRYANTYHFHGLTRLEIKA